MRTYYYGVFTLKRVVCDAAHSEPVLELESSLPGASHPGSCGLCVCVFGTPLAIIITWSCNFIGPGGAGALEAHGESGTLARSSYITYYYDSRVGKGF